MSNYRVRQRAVDVNDTKLFIDTGPRPVNRRPYPSKAPQQQASNGSGDEMTEGRAWTLLALSVALLVVGVWLVRGNHYAHLHRRVEAAYYEYLQEWDTQHAAVFAVSEWQLEVEGHNGSVPLAPSTFKSKRVAVPAAAAPGTAAQPASASSGAAYDAGTSNTSSSSGSSRRRAAQSRLLEFRADKLLPLLFPGLKAAPLLDQHRIAHSKGMLWRPVLPELRRGRGMTLVGRDGATGAESRVELGKVVFARERSVPAGGEGRCMYDQKGVWQLDNTCGVHEYLWALCVKVTRDPATGKYTADTELGGGPGCSDESGWELGNWRRLDPRKGRINGRLYLPQAARNATTITVKHTRDPSVRERDILRRTAPNMEHQILFHALGMAMIFMGAVVLLSVAAFAAPKLLRRVGLWRGAAGRRRGRHHGGKDSDDDMD
ncbi:hypothetical protein HYH02_005228 [Chlamydomonas schloesseri]|uniref:Uncharacterized protein n=1 Tax=Chlamydomonas schloesseri TaxID=2026947 RepID=A0A835WN38_9CHLO|nr:hypothetical protein HYH02_005228 [Chlamydomonas schloesseri]|eukprot:KAG2449700.1 hypothetical protein HYH02_005228 [Chlamydomonas schloesseri]